MATSYSNHLHITAADVMTLLPNINFTPSIQPINSVYPISVLNLLPVITFLAICYSSTLSQCPNYLNTLIHSTRLLPIYLFEFFYVPHFKLYPFVTLPPNFSNISFRELSLSLPKYLVSGLLRTTYLGHLT